MDNVSRKQTISLTVFALSLLVVHTRGDVSDPLPRKPQPKPPSYCIVASSATYGEPSWKKVVEALAAKHQAQVLVYQRSMEETLPRLCQELPRYICFVARPMEAGREFVAQVNQLTRRLDDDPYTDALWGILTGYDADNALRIARQKDPLVIRRVAAGTEVELAACLEGEWYCELNQGKMVRKQPGGKPEPFSAPPDTTKSLVEALGRCDLFVTSGHATERDWQIGYRYRNGQFRCQDGKLFGLDTQGRRHPVPSNPPKVYLPVGNCLMGHIDGHGAMALAFMNSAGVCQMIGYTVPTWYGYGGWGLLDYFVEQPGRFTLAEAFFANQQALLHRLATCFPGLESPTTEKGKIPVRRELPAPAKAAGLTWQDARGLLYDRDNVAFFGDPAWEARMAPGPLAWSQTLTERDGEYQLEIKPLRGERSFKPVNTNGSQRGGRPIIQLLPRRIDPHTVKILQGTELKPLVTRNFLLVPLPDSSDPEKVHRVVFRATSAK